MQCTGTWETTSTPVQANKYTPNTAVAPHHMIMMLMMARDVVAEMNFWATAVV